jgi:hypothetical protein
MKRATPKAKIPRTGPLALFNAAWLHWRRSPDSGLVYCGRLRRCTPLGNSHQHCYDREHEKDMDEVTQNMTSYDPHQAEIVK